MICIKKITERKSVKQQGKSKLALKSVMYLLFPLFPVRFFFFFFLSLLFWFSLKTVEQKGSFARTSGGWVGYLFQDKPPMDSQVIDTTDGKKRPQSEGSEKKGRRLKSEERQGEEAIESTQQWWWWSEDGYCLKQSSHVQNNSTNGTRKGTKNNQMQKGQEEEYLFFLK